MPDTKYATWIAAYQASVGDTTGKCHAACKAMLLEFPGLRLARGHVLHVGDGKPWPHWWLVDWDGSIVDPTADQFTLIVQYDEWEDGRDEPTGKCPGCGGYCYGGRSVCGDACASAYVAYLQDAVRRG